MGAVHVLLVHTSGSLYRCMPDHTRGAGVPVLCPVQGACPGSALTLL